MIYFHDRVAFKNGNEIIIAHVNGYDDNFVYTSYKAFPLNAVIGKFTFENGINYQDKYEQYQQFLPDIMCYLLQCF